jgi:hypothetical protein
LPFERIERAILFIRGNKATLDRDVAELYGVKAIALRQQIGRNETRFPPDFMFRLSHEEAEALVSQNVIPSIWCSITQPFLSERHSKRPSAGWYR